MLPCAGRFAYCGPDLLQGFKLIGVAFSFLNAPRHESSLFFGRKGAFHSVFTCLHIFLLFISVFIFCFSINY